MTQQWAAIFDLAGQQVLHQLIREARDPGRHIETHGLEQFITNSSPLAVRGFQ